MLGILKKSKYVDLDINSKTTFFQGIWMWSLLFFGYMFFCANWLIMSKLEGTSASSGQSSGWAQKFSISSEILKEAVNYLITLARGIGSICASFILIKLTHKYSVIFAMAFTCVSLPLIYSPNFVFFNIGRVLMGFGGTLIIVYIQPVISKFFNLKTKGLLSTFNGMAYVVGALIINSVFLISSVSTFLVKHWQHTATVFSLLTFIPLLLYAIKGVNFDINASQENNKIQNTNLNEKNNLYIEVLKSKRTWVWILTYSALIVVSVLISNFIPKLLKTTGGYFEGVAFSSGVEWTSLATCIAYSGSGCGMVMGLLNKIKMKKTVILMFSHFLTLFFWIVLLLSAYLLKNNSTAASILIFTSMFCVAFFGLGIQSVALYIPHEYKDFTTKKISIFFAYLWGFGYVVYTIYKILIVVLWEIAGKTGAGQHIVMGLVTFAMALYFVLAFLIEEPNKHLPTFPWQKTTTSVFKKYEINNRKTWKSFLIPKSFLK